MHTFLMKRFIFVLFALNVTLAFSQDLIAQNSGTGGKWVLRVNGEFKAMNGSKYSSFNGVNLSGAGAQLTRESGLTMLSLKYRYLLNNNATVDLTDGNTDKRLSMSYASSQGSLGGGLRFGSSTSQVRPYLGIFALIGYESIRLVSSEVQTLNSEELGYSNGYEASIGTLFKLGGSSGAAKLSAFLEFSCQDAKANLLNKNNFQFGGYVLTGGIEW